MPPPRYCWDDDEDGRFSAATRSALLANCLLPIAQLSCAVPMAAKAGDALLLEPSTPERVSGFSSLVPVAVSGLQHDIQEYNEGEGKILNGNCNSVEVSNHGVEQGVSSTQPEKAWLPLRKLFTEECETQSSCSSSEADELDGVPAETYCIWRPKPAPRDQFHPHRRHLPQSVNASFSYTDGLENISDRSKSKGPFLSEPGPRLHSFGVSEQ
nr:uncharacterized protein LOC109155132 isoform X1 [Ipomoea batatas]